jgi:hypothetical protein
MSCIVKSTSKKLLGMHRKKYQSKNYASSEYYCKIISGRELLLRNCTDDLLSKYYRQNITIG